MRFALISFGIQEDNTPTLETRDFINIINSNIESDIIVFGGWTLNKKSDLAKSLKQITNKNSLVFFEVLNDKINGEAQHRGYVLQQGKLLNNVLPQIFYDSFGIEGNKELMEEYLNELERNRIFEKEKCKICYLICGENNIISNVQSDGQRAKFRMDKDKKFSLMFNKIYNETKIFINPTHTRMGNQGKMEQRRNFLSSNERISITVSNECFEYEKLSELGDKLMKLESLQYLYYNRKRIPLINIACNNRYIERRCEVNL